MKLHPRVTRAGVELVKRFEGYRRHAARLADGGFVLGYGHSLTARDGAEVSEPDAEALLWFDLSHTAEHVEAVVLAPVSAPQFEALTSFAFNIGLENFAGSTALRRLNEGAYLQAAAAIELWRRAEFDGDARVVDALVRRRAAEKAHFLAPPEGFAPAPTGVIRPTFDHSVLAAALAWGERGEATVVTAPALDGEAVATIADPPGREHGEGAPSAAIAAVDAVSARLSRILPDAEPPAPEPLTLTPTDEPAAPAAEVDRSVFASSLELPAPPTPAAHVFEADPEAEPAPAPPVRAFAFEPLSPPAALAPEAFEPAAASRTTFEPLATTATSAPTLFQSVPAANDFNDQARPHEEEPTRAERPAADPVLENPIVFMVLGLVGVALFTGAVVCMFRHPSLLCLLSGLAGVLAIAPAAAFFLFRLIGTPVDAAPAGGETADGGVAEVEPVASASPEDDGGSLEAPSKAS